MGVTISPRVAVENPRNRASAPRARAKEQPQDKAQKRQEEHDQTPQHLAPGRGAGIDGRNDRPQPEGEEDKAAETGEFCHGVCPSVAWREGSRFGGGCNLIQFSKSGLCRSDVKLDVDLYNEML